jgi:hypothetical protein
MVFIHPAVESLFVDVPALTPNPSNGSTPASNGDTNTGAIAGGVAGSVASLMVVAAVVYYLLKRRGRKGQSIKFREPELDVSVNTDTGQLVQQGNSALQRELRTSTLFELSSNRERYEADTRAPVARYEMS